LREAGRPGKAEPAGDEQAPGLLRSLLQSHGVA